AAVLRLDRTAAVSGRTSRTLRMGNLAPGIGPFPPVEKGPTSLGFADHPTAPFTLLPRNSQPLLGIVRNGCSGSVGTTARDQSVRVLGINWNSCSGSLGAPTRVRASRSLQVQNASRSANGRVRIRRGFLQSAPTSFLACLCLRRRRRATPRSIPAHTTLPLALGSVKMRPGNAAETIDVATTTDLDRAPTRVRRVKRVKISATISRRSCSPTIDAPPQ